MSVALQYAYEAIDDAIGLEPDTTGALIRAKCRGLMHGYDSRWKNAGYETLETEVILKSDLYNPATERTSRTFKVAGKLDVVARHEGRLVLFDHKTTSQDIADPNSSYWRQLVVESQPSHYMLLAWMNGRKFDEAVWDCIKKPNISPKTMAKKDRQGVVVSKHYCGRRMSQETLEAMQTVERETLEMYEARLANDCTVERPQNYFQRRAVPRMDHEMLEFAGELWEHGRDIADTLKNNRHVRNSGACMLYGSPCKFLGICSGYDDQDSDKWQRKAQVHSELDLDGDGRDVLTNSRIRSYQTCKRKHYFEYVAGIERQDEEEKESLFFGSVFHEALRVWFDCFKHEESSNGNSARPVNEIGSCGASQTANAR